MVRFGFIPLAFNALITSMLCTIPAPSSCAPSPSSQLSKWPPTVIISAGNSVPLISPITLKDGTCGNILQLFFTNTSTFFPALIFALSIFALLVLIASAGILGNESLYLVAPVCG